MKRALSRISGLIVLLLIALAFVSCSLLGGFEFINRSSYTVQVTPFGQDSWSSFKLDPGESNKINVDEQYITFLYSPSSLVNCDQSQDGKAIFTNR